MWDSSDIVYIDLTKEVNDKCLIGHDFFLNREEEGIWIKGIKYGVDQERIAIIVNQSTEIDSIYIWEMDSNTEYDSFDVGKIYELIWDHEGNLQIVTPNHVIFT